MSGSKHNAHEIHHAHRNHSGFRPDNLGEQLRVCGVVQGVGFRPAVWQLAHALGLHGSVLNDGEGVLIDLWGSKNLRDRFVLNLKENAPPLAVIDSIDRYPVAKNATSPQGFTIESSETGVVNTAIPADASICTACAEEVQDPSSRRYRYPFTNCTHCGPRLTIITGLPYDRPSTAMAGFPLCEKCEAEYRDPADRRFHAQPIACPECGPKVTLVDSVGEPVNISGQDAIEFAARLLKQGNIFAIKGLGGFHLACDATNKDAIAALRKRKQRPDKPLAVMMQDLAMAEQHVRVTPFAETLLCDSKAPIVLLQKTKTQANTLPEILAPGLPELGVMLPYTPLHLTLMHDVGRPLVMTSGNLSGNPQCTDNELAQKEMEQIADFFLLHNRDIVFRTDDSVVRPFHGPVLTDVYQSKPIEHPPQVIRRGRGFAPKTIDLPEGFSELPPVLAMGSEMKNTFCLVRDGQATVSPYMGDLKHAATFHSYRAGLDAFVHMYQHKADLIGVDLHPNYLSTQHGHTVAEEQGIPAIAVQHHHAHIASCMAENCLPLDHPPVLGICFDGLGLGDDGTLWGGEFLRVDYQGYQRLGCMVPVAMPGGEQASKQPWRNLYAQLRQDNWQDIVRQFSTVPSINKLNNQPLPMLESLIKNGVNCPQTSSVGRLFDAVAAALGIYFEGISYDGQAAIELEALALDALTLNASTIETSSSNPEDHLAAETGYPFSLPTKENSGTAAGALSVLETLPMWQQFLTDLSQGVTPSLIAYRFHIGLADHSVNQALYLAKRFEKKPDIVLSGGVFQNQLLLSRLVARLREEGFTVYTHKRVPANDGGLSLGQAAITAARTATDS